MGKHVDLVGQKFNNLTVVSLGEKNSKGSYLWNCVCDCGGTTSVVSSSLKNGNTRSCGCLRQEVLLKRNTTHGKSDNPAYSAWKGMFKRCRPNDKRHESYYDRGITVHPDFKDFLVFLAEIGEKPNDGQRWSVGRIDNNKGYEPGNVRWELDEQQARNHAKQKNNTSGIVGVHIKHTTAAGKVYESFVGTYHSLEGKKVSKDFSTNKYGYEGAKQLAIQFREEGMRKLQEQGAGYAESHGSDK